MSELFDSLFELCNHVHSIWLADIHSQKKRYKRCH